MGSSAQNSSGVPWCRCQVRFNKVPEKLPKVPEEVPEKVWEALFGAGLGQVQQGSGEGFGGVEKKDDVEDEKGEEDDDKRDNVSEEEVEDHDVG